MRFTKMQGLGNDYLYVYGEVPENAAELSSKLSDRRFGAGSDGMIFITRSGVADFGMRIFNADGSEGNMCGNAIRCVARYLVERVGGFSDVLSIETLSGIKRVTVNRDEGGAFLSASVTAAVGAGAPSVSVAGAGSASGSPAGSFAGCCSVPFPVGVSGEASEA